MHDKPPPPTEPGEESEREERPPRPRSAPRKKHGDDESLAGSSDEEEELLYRDEEFFSESSAHGHSESEVGSDNKEAGRKKRQQEEEDKAARKRREEETKRKKREREKRIRKRKKMFDRPLPPLYRQKTGGIIVKTKEKGDTDKDSNLNERPNSANASLPSGIKPKKPKEKKYRHKRAKKTKQDKESEKKESSEPPFQKKEPAKEKPQPVAQEKKKEEKKKEEVKKKEEKQKRLKERFIPRPLSRSISLCKDNPKDWGALTEWRKNSNHLRVHSTSSENPKGSRQPNMSKKSPKGDNEAKEKSNESKEGGVQRPKSAPGYIPTQYPNGDKNKKQSKNRTEKEHTRPKEQFVPRPISRSISLFTCKDQRKDWNALNEWRETSNHSKTASTRGENPKDGNTAGENPNDRSEENSQRPKSAPMNIPTQYPEGDKKRQQPKKRTRKELEDTFKRTPPVTKAHTFVYFKEDTNDSNGDKDRPKTSPEKANPKWNPLFNNNLISRTHSEATLYTARDACTDDVRPYRPSSSPMKLHRTAVCSPLRSVSALQDVHERPLSSGRLPSAPTNRLRYNPSYTYGK